MENNTVVAITRSRKSLYLAGAFLVIIIGAAGVYFFIYSQSSGMTSGTRDFVASPAEEIKNPIEYFYEHFSAKNYHVRVIGKDSTEGLSFYYEKGVIVRIDGEGTYNSDHVSIIKNGKLYSINEKDKVFGETGLEEFRTASLLELYKAGSVLDPILQGETPTATPWTVTSQNTTNNDVREYQTTGRKFVSSAPGNMGTIDIKVTLDTRTGLITTASLKSAYDKDWRTVNFQYEEVNNIESLKNFPRDYKKVDSL